MPSSRRLLLFIGLGVGVSLSFSLGAWSSQIRIGQQVAANDARIAELGDRMALSVLQARRARVLRPMGTDGDGTPGTVATDGDSQRTLIEDIKRQLQSEMGLLPVRLLRQRRESFVQLNASDNFGKSGYGTAGYLGDGYFITVKHGVIALDENVEGATAPHHVDQDSLPGEGSPGSGRRQWRCVRRSTPRRLGDHQSAGKLDLPPLRVDTRYAYEFAEPVFRLGNDYSKGIICKHRVHRGADTERSRDVSD